MDGDLRSLGSAALEDESLELFEVSVVEVEAPGPAAEPAPVSAPVEPES